MTGRGGGGHVGSDELRSAGTRRRGVVAWLKGVFVGIRDQKAAIMAQPTSMASARGRLTVATVALLGGEPGQKGLPAGTTASMIATAAAVPRAVPAAFASREQAAGAGAGAKVVDSEKVVVV